MAMVNSQSSKGVDSYVEDSDDDIFYPNSPDPLRENDLQQTYANSINSRLNVSDSCIRNTSTNSFSDISTTTLESEVFLFRSENSSTGNDDLLWDTGLTPNHIVSTTLNNKNNHPGGQINNNTPSRHDSVQSADSDVSLHRRSSLRDRQPSIVDGLLFEIYDRWHGYHGDSFDSDTFTECSSTSEVFHSRWDTCEAHEDIRHSRQLHRTFLESQTTAQLKKTVQDLQRTINQVSGRLVRQLKRRDRRLAKQRRNCDVVTAILQAASLKRQIDTRMKFSLEPPPTQSAFDQWKDAMKAVGRLPMGIPAEFRKKAWLSLADHYVRQLKIDWLMTVRFAFNERSNPDDDKLGLQIVKDLHRTGCSSFSGQDNEEDRAVLKRVLLAYARWNKRVGYCQGFNVIAALLLDVTDRKEDDALKLMIYLIDHVLPESYFDNNLRALSVDMAVFRDLLRLTLPTLSRHLDHLQHAAQDSATGACYEPPLTNVFTMQWFLTLFATCLPKEIVLRVWDAIFLEGSEVLLRTALCIWGKLARRIMTVGSADEFYSLMGELSSDMMEGGVFSGDDIVKAIYALAPFPFPQLTELREKYTYNIRPFSNTMGPSKRASRMAKAVLYSDEDELDDDEIHAIACFPGLVPMQAGKGKGGEGLGSAADISVLGPGAYSAETDMTTTGKDSMYMERMTTDITALKKQYEKLRQRQRQAHVISAAVASSKKKVQIKQKVSMWVPNIESPVAMNHLFVGKVGSSGRNRLITDGPSIVPSGQSVPRNSLLRKQLQAVASAQAASRIKLGYNKKNTAKPIPSSPQANTASENCNNLKSLSPHTDKQLASDEHLPRVLDVYPGKDSANNGDVTTASFISVEDNLRKREHQTASECQVHADLSRSDRNVDSFSDTSRKAEATPSERCDFTMTLSYNHNHDNAKEQACDKDSGKTISEKEISGSPQNFVASSEEDGNNSGVCLPCPAKETVISSPIKRALRPLSVPLPKSSLVQTSGTHYINTANSSPEGMLANIEYHNKFAVQTQENCNGSNMQQNKTKSCHLISQSPSASPVSPSQGPLMPVQPKLQISSSATTSPIIPQQPISPLQTQFGLTSSPLKIVRPFNPFPVKHLNTNRAKTGLKLGLYTPSTLEHIQEQLMGVGMMTGKKARNASS